jgi:hypothetical protein
MEAIKNRIGEFGEQQIKGINLAVMGLAKKFNFITGWELSNTWDRWPAMITINLIVDLEKVGKFYNVKMSDYWLEEWYSDEFVSTSYILTLSEDGNSSPEETHKIDNNLKSLYEIIPDVFSVFYEYKTSEINFEDKCFTKLNRFQNKPTQKIYYSI